MRRLYPAVSALMFAFAVGNPQPAAAQLLSTTFTTQPGQPVAVRLADPFARVEQERSLRAFLAQPTCFSWNEYTTLQDVQYELAMHVAIDIDYRSLDELGLSADLSVLNTGRAKMKTRPKPVDPFDPFGHSSAATDQNNPFAETASASQTVEKPSQRNGSESPRWWTRAGTKVSVAKETNASMLFSAMALHDLTLSNCEGRWLVTTKTAAEQCLSTRVYDVTPMVTETSDPPNHGSGGRVFIGSTSMRTRRFADATDRLIDVIVSAIDTNEWEEFGGPSTIRPCQIGERRHLVISARVTTQWAIQSLLNQLNQAP